MDLNEMPIDSHESAYLVEEKRMENKYEQSL